MRHVLQAERGYLAALGWKVGPAVVDEEWSDRVVGRAEVLRGLEASGRGDIAPRGPRGGRRWPPRYFVRRAVWHVLDHSWEVEDRSS
ncbi:MAG TPA: hypothetical protein VNO34_07275 [Actinomycetota bacterium]|nr:hypothetical protein [Actinomycetota bacterium]